MALEFEESLTLQIPNIEAQLAEFSEGESSHHGLIIEVAAIHEGTTANFNHYSEAELNKSLESWVSPYPKPIIMNHDAESEPIGRIIQAKMDKEADGTPFVRLQAAITDPEAIKKISDKRYLTGSVGGRATEANCSICQADWANASMFNLPCKHVRGKAYKGQIARIEMKNIGFKEYSFVNMPADQHSGVRSVGTGSVSEESPEESEGWAKARIFDLNMDKQEVFEYTESESLNVLSGMKQKDAAPLYHSLRGAFLSALAVSESEQEESQTMDTDVNVTTENEDEDDILAVTEELSSDLAKLSEAEIEVEVDEESTDTEADADAEEAVETTDETAAEEAEVETEETATAEEENSEEAEKPKRPEGQSKITGDVDPETSKFATTNKTRENEETEVVVEEDESAISDLNERILTLESLVTELQTEAGQLNEANAKLRDLLKKSLAERVVDTKISLGMEEKDSRAELVEEHMTKRTARSLADSLRDLASMAPKERVNYDNIPIVESGSLALDAETHVTTISNEATQENKIDPEAFFTNVLMGRQKLR